MWHSADQATLSPPAPPVHEASIEMAATQRRPPKRGRGFYWPLTLVTSTAVVLGAAFAIASFRDRAAVRPATHTVRFGPLPLSLVVRGELQSAFNTEIVNHVRSNVDLKYAGRYTPSIRWVIEDGTSVRKGQLLVELDDTLLQDELAARRIILEQTLAEWIQAEENLKIVQIENQDAIKSAEVAIQLAQIDLTRYLKGEYEQARKDVEGKVALAESDLEMQRARAAWSQQMLKKGFLTPNQLREESASLRKAEVGLDKLYEEDRVLKHYTRKRKVAELENRQLAQARLALQTCRGQARAKEAQADVARLDLKRMYQKRLDRIHDMEEQVAQCSIAAPHDGLVVIRVPEQARSGGAQQSIVAQGEPVREGQVLMDLPDLSRMQVKTGVHESLAARVRADVVQPTGFVDSIRASLLTGPDLLARLSAEAAWDELRLRFHDFEQAVVDEGQTAWIKLDAFPDRLLRGRVKQIATVASSLDDWSSNEKVYRTVIAIEDAVDGLKPGMNAEVTIELDDEPEDVLTVPVKAVFGDPDAGRNRHCLVVTPEGVRKRDVVVGAYNDDSAEIVSGLAEGDEVVLDPHAVHAGE